MRPAPVHAFALAQGLLVRCPVSMRAPEEVSAFTGLDLDAAVVVAFGQILSSDILAAPRLGCFNLHGSLLPRWRGAAPIQRAIMAGDGVTGVQVMRMSEGLDEGPILATTRLRIDALDTAGTLHDRMAPAGAALMVQALTALADGRSDETEQSGDGATYAKKIKSKEARIRWDRPAVEVDRQIRGLAPFPGAWFTAISGPAPLRIKALLSSVETGEGEPGEVLDDRLLIGCGVGAVRILRAQREGRAAQDSQEFLRGFQLGARVT